MTLWLDPSPLVLASRSAGRQALLKAAGIPLEIRPADIDERAVEARAGIEAADQAAALLAREKTLAVARELPGRVVLGADQTLVFEGQRFSKPADRDAAVRQLRALRGRTHALHSAVAIARDGSIAFEHAASARLTMRAFSDDFLQRYLDAVGPAVTASVGGYQLEGVGIQLFERVEGDHSTIVGLPLLPVLDWLRRAGLLAA